MTPETTVFLLTLVLGVIHLSIGAGIQIAEVGLLAVMKSRDDLPPIKSRFGLRGERANHNFKETLPWALGLLLLIQITNQANAISALGAWVYFWSRAIYIPMYVFGIPVLRSIAYTIALLGLGIIASQIF